MICLRTIYGLLSHKALGEFRCRSALEDRRLLNSAYLQACPNPLINTSRTVPSAVDPVRFHWQSLILSLSIYFTRGHPPMLNDP